MKDSSNNPGNQQPRILLLGSQMATGGAQRVLLDQARWFHERGYPVTAAFFYDREGLLAQYQTECPSPLIDLEAWRKGGGLLNIFRLAGGLIRLYRLLKKEKIQVIETFTHHANLLGIPIAWAAGVRQSIAAHQGHVENLGSWMGWFHSRLINSGMTSALVAVSQGVRQLAIDQERILPKKIVVIPNGVAPVKKISKEDPLLPRMRADLGIQPGDFIFLTVGRLQVQKGHTYLLDAIPGIIQQFPGTIFLFSGDGSLREELEAKSQALGVQKHIRFLGVRDDIPILLSLANGFLMPSLWEGMPLALLEAIQAGLPVVATQVEGVEEILQDGVNGLLVPKANPQALADAIRRLLENPRLQANLALAGKKSVAEHYTIDAMCLAYEKLFLKTLE